MKEEFKVELIVGHELTERQLERVTYNIAETLRRRCREEGLLPSDADSYITEIIVGKEVKTMTDTQMKYRVMIGK
jgi:hypothetical protein